MVVLGSSLALAANKYVGTDSFEPATKTIRNYSYEQRLEMMRTRQTQMHPMWENLTGKERIARVAMFVRQLFKPTVTIQATGLTQSDANFQGNLTAINGPSGSAIVLQRKADCSLDFSFGTYTLSFTKPGIQVTNTTPQYQNVLHDASGLTTTGNTFTGGCMDATLGIGSRRGFYLGMTSQNLYMFATSGYDYMAGSNALYFVAIDSATQTVDSFGIELSLPEINAITAGDLNGDGLADIVGLDRASGSISVWTVNHDGSIGSPSSYALPEDSTRAAVMEDFDRDGKVDVVVSTFNLSSGQEQISILTGKGDGTLNAAQSFPVSTPTGNFSLQPLQTMVAADLRGTGYPDIVGSNGLVLLNNGGGTFSVGTPAFPARDATSSWGPEPGGR